MDSIKEVWDQVLSYINEEFIISQKRISDVAFKTWICCLQLHDLAGEGHDEAVLTAHSDFQVRTASKYSSYLKEAFEAVLGFPVTLRLTVSPAAPAAPASGGEFSLRSLYAEDAAPAAPAQPAHAPLADELSEEYTFENFIVGQGNKFAHAASLAVAQNPAGLYNPLFIYGPSGLGKTHLLNAIRHEIHLNRPDLNILMIKGVDFTNDLVDAIQNGTVNEYNKTFLTVDVLLMDDIHFIAGKERTQEEFFHTFNRLYEAKKQIVLTSDRPPREMPTLEDRLRTRFEMGLLADIAYPDFETRLAIIRRKAKVLGITLPDDVCEFIANRLKSNIRQLEGTVKKMKIYNDLGGDPPSISLAQIAIGDILSEDKPLPVTIEKIIDEVCRTYSITPVDIRSKKRTTQISNARKVAMYVIRQVTQLSLPSIGKEFNRDHSTVVYSLKDVTEEMERNQYFKATVDDIIKNVSD